MGHAKESASINGFTVEMRFGIPYNRLTLPILLFLHRTQLNSFVVGGFCMRITYKVFSSLLALCVIFNLIVPSFAANYTTNSSEKIIDLDDIEPAISEQEAQELSNKIIENVYLNLDDEAKAIFDSLAFGDNNLSDSFVGNDRSIFIDSQITPAAVINLLASLNSKIATLALPEAVTSALSLMGATLIAAIADGPLPIGDILFAAASVSLVVICALNWSVVAPKWTQIVNAFTSVFTNSISNFINAFNQIKNDTVVEYYTTTYPVTVNLTTQTITIGSSQFICATQAENAASQILNGNGKHFIALRLKKPADVVMVASMPVSTNVAAAILAYDSSFAGVMSCDAASARQPCNLLGGIIRDEENHGINRIGYWTHYHAVLAPHAHSWFYSKIV